MSANFLRMPDDLTERYKATAKVLNAELAQKGLKPIKPTELMRIVMARIVGLPVSHDIEIDAVTEAAKKAPAKAKKAPAKGTTTTSEMWTRPHGGRSKKAAATKAPAKQAKRTSKKAPAKKASATAERWTPPHGG